MPNFNLNILDAVDRRVRITSSGMEITTTFYVEPATATPIVICALLGHVSGTDRNSYARTPPAHDFEYPFCYCVEARPKPMDSRSGTSSPALMQRDFSVQKDFANIQDALTKPIIFDGPLSQKPDGDYTAENRPGLCGAFIEAVYRPLPTIYSEYARSPAQWDDPDNAFDYIDPQFYPCSGAVATSGSLYVLPSADDSSWGIGVAGSPQLVDSWTEITIRRVMCPSVPWETIRQLTNRVNVTNAWTPMHMTIPGLPNNEFPIGTLRFDSAEVIKRTMPTCFDSNEAIILKDASREILYEGDNNFNTATGTLSQTVNKAPLTVTADDKTMVHGNALPTFTATYAGWVLHDTFSSAVTGLPDLTTSASSSSSAGLYTIHAAVGTLAADNYSFNYNDGVLTIT